MSKCACKGDSGGIFNLQPFVVLNIAMMAQTAKKYFCIEGPVITDDGSIKYEAGTMDTAMYDVRGDARCPVNSHRWRFDEMRRDLDPYSTLSMKKNS